MQIKFLVLSASVCLLSVALAAPFSDHSTATNKVKMVHDNSGGHLVEAYKRTIDETHSDDPSTDDTKKTIVDEIKERLQGHSDLDGARHFVGDFVPIKPIGKTIDQTGLPDGEGIDPIGKNDYDVYTAFRALGLGTDTVAKTLKGSDSIYPPAGHKSNLNFIPGKD
ncbi:hypothetical protein G6F56_000196 [Rhizopus delemar]|nr:hypothetical protein G6F56_000196 [Rhizopus delemar]